MGTAHIIRAFKNFMNSRDFLMEGPVEDGFMAHKTDLSDHELEVVSKSVSWCVVFQKERLMYCTSMGSGEMIYLLESTIQTQKFGFEKKKKLKIGIVSGTNVFISETQKGSHTWATPFQKTPFNQFEFNPFFLQNWFHSNRLKHVFLKMGGSGLGPLDVKYKRKVLKYIKDNLARNVYTMSIWRFHLDVGTQNFFFLGTNTSFFFFENVSCQILQISCLEIQELHDLLSCSRIGPALLCYSVEKDLTCIIPSTVEKSIGCNKMTTLVSTSTHWAHWQVTRRLGCPIKWFCFSLILLLIVIL